MLTTKSPSPDLNVAVAAYLARYEDQTRIHADSDLRCFLTWCTDVDLQPMQARRVDLERFLRWMQLQRHYKPSTVSHRLSVDSGFYRTAVIDGVLAQSPAEHVRRPRVPAESPTLGLSHLQFEALLIAGRDSTNPNDLALVSMLGLLEPRDGGDHEAHPHRGTHAGWGFGHDLRGLQPSALVRCGVVAASRLTARLSRAW